MKVRIYFDRLDGLTVDLTPEQVAVFKSDETISWDTIFDMLSDEIMDHAEANLVIDDVVPL